MDIVVKVAGKSEENSERAILRCVEEALGDAGAGEVAVSPVFLGAKTGRRAGILVVRLPDRLPKTAIEVVLDRLRSEALIEYARAADAQAPDGIGVKRPMIRESVPGPHRFPQHPGPCHRRMS